MRATRWQKRQTKPMDKKAFLGHVQDFLEKLGIPVERIDEEVVGPQTLFQVHSPESGVLIGTGGETLRAFNHIVRKFADRKGEERSEEDHSFLVDVNGYHAQKIAEIQKGARLLADRARLFQHDVEMSPMSSYERMIVHAFLASDPDVVTESEGEGKFRRVVVRYKKGGKSAPSSIAKE
jgi:spoIIIJ-associated protein